MALGYREFAITSRRRNTGGAFGSKLFLPGSGSSTNTSGTICGVVDMATDSYSEFATLPNRTRSRAAQVYGSKLFMPSSNPSTNAAVCGVLDMASNSYSEFTLTAGHFFAASAKVGSTMFAFSSGLNNFIGVIDMASNSYSAITRPGSFARTAPLAVGGKVFVPRAGATTCEIIDATSLAVATITIPNRTGWFPGGVIGGLGYFLSREGPNPTPAYRVAVADPVANTLTELGAAVSITTFLDEPTGDGITIDNKVYWPSEDIMWSWDGTSFLGDAMVPGRLTRSVMAYYDGRIYLPTMGLTPPAICGVVFGLLPEPTPTRRRRGFGAIRG